jgi:hypothetical protein
MLAEQPKENELRLSCAICMDIMKQETSTVCRHIFCQSCILCAIEAKKSAPHVRENSALKM